MEENPEKRTKRLKTGASTKVYTKWSNTRNAVRFVVKDVDMWDGSPENTYKVPEKEEIVSARRLLMVLREELAARKVAKRRPQLVRAVRAGEKEKYSDSINRKREKVIALLEGCGGKANLRKIAGQAKVSYEMVRTVSTRMRIIGRPLVFSYNNLHTEEEEEELDFSIGRIHESCLTTTDLKRRHSSFSRKAILRRLHESGLRWRALPREAYEKKQKHGSPNAQYIRYVITCLASALSDPDVDVYYLDEMIFPLNQTSRMHWSKSNEEDMMIYGGREDAETLTAIAVCSVRKFEAVQIVRNAVNAKDFAYFVNYFTGRLPEDRQAVILLDNASWHDAALVKSLPGFKYLLFNEPRQFRLNLIENAFSYVRACFRKRLHCTTIEDEAATIVKIFFDSCQPAKFEGFLRNHVRSLLAMADKYDNRQDPAPLQQD